jgi:hypothetical protein
VRRKYYENVEDAIVMWCHDVGSVEQAHRLRDIEDARRMSVQRSLQ